MQSAASDEVSVATLMAASNAAAREAAAAAHWAWLLGYELKVALQQEWPGPGARQSGSLCRVLVCGVSSRLGIVRALAF
jgi:hypothetical protein